MKNSRHPHKRFRHPKNSKRNFQSHSGAVLVEIAIAIPIFLIFVFMFIWISTTQNELTTLTTAVQHGTRLAVTRGKADNMGYNHLAGEGLIPAIDNLTYSNNALKLISSQDQTNQAENTYNLWSNETFGENFTDLPPFYRYAIMYISQAMKRGVGNSVRFPCDPNDPSNQDERNGKGCLKCRFINPDYLTGLNAVDFRDPIIYSLYDEEPPEDHIGIVCEFKPAGNLYQIVGNLINLVSRQSTWDENTMIRSAFFRSPV